MSLTKSYDIILFFLFLVFIFCLFSVQVSSPDLWWHLKTGEYIYQTGTLPETDPFAYTSIPNDPIGAESKKIKFTLQQCWLSQLIFFWIYHSFHFTGIIFLRTMLIMLLLLLLYKGVQREGMGPYLSMVLLIPVVVIFYYGFNGERLLSGNEANCQVLCCFRKEDVK